MNKQSKKVRKCSNCGKEGHYVTTCPSAKKNEPGRDQHPKKNDKTKEEKSSKKTAETTTDRKLADDPEAVHQPAPGEPGSTSNPLEDQEIMDEDKFMETTPMLL